ncbi:TSUP family transporter [Variovorax sp. RA8]|uniref:TSUP family transporter n=1 Tax=Variovorax sp. (strain JCM 16519 / RA8) TaxID=662548 RepID=UPI0013A5BDC2|nr:TSUP family transporter [Variovorax sp. RA8]
MIPLETAFLFLGCVAAATFVQNLTGFAMGLVLLGLVELLHVVPLAEAVNATMVLALVNATAFFRSHGGELPWRPLRHAMPASLAGVVIGIGLLAWLSANAQQFLRLLLGVVVVLSALALLLRNRQLAQPSPPAAFAAAGLLSGVLGGLFATSGPPIVFHLYRQPFEPNFVRRCLTLMFSANNAFRLVLVAGAGHFSMRSLLLSGMALPVVYAVTRWCVRHPLPVSERALRTITALLLAVTGVSLAASAGSWPW